MYYLKATSIIPVIDGDLDLDSDSSDNRYYILMWYNSRIRHNVNVNA